MTEASVAVALSVLLGNLRLVELPNGGSIALAVVPLLALALARGTRTALLACSCAGAAHALAGGTIIHPAQLLLDYCIAYAVLAVAGIARGRLRSRRYVSAAITLAMLLHLSAMVASGVIFFAPVAGGAALTYSLAYNAATVVPELLLSLWLVPRVVDALARANPADAWRRGLLEPPVQRQRVPRTIHAPASIDTPPPGQRVSHAAVTELPKMQRRSTLVRTAPFAARSPLAAVRQQQRGGVS